MTRPQNEAPVVVNPATGEVVEAPTISSINVELVDLNRRLADMQKPMADLLAEQQRVCLRYDLEFSAAVLASPQRSEDRRKADAIQHVAKVTLEDSPESLATRKSLLEMRIRAMRDAGHDIRARMSALQTIANNLRTETNLLRYQT